MSDSVNTSVEDFESKESLETDEDPKVKSENEKSESPSLKSGNELPKPRRRGRRGKKRKHRKDSGAVCGSETQDDQEAGESNDWKSDEEDMDFKCSVLVRPIDVPKAPENYNTFIMDEHDECHLYMSFETPNPYATNAEQLRDENCAIINPHDDAAYMDINYEYISQDNVDNVAFYDREFEESYKNNRFDELIRLPREELIAGLHVLESRLRQLSDELLGVNPSPVLGKLQAELLELQEKHLELKECNARLTALVMHNDGGSAPGESPATSQTLTDGFSPQSDLVSPSHMSDLKSELLLSEQSPRKSWSFYSPIYDRGSQGEMPDIEDDLLSYSKTSDFVITDGADKIASAESSVSAKFGESYPLQTSLNASPEDGKYQSPKQHSEYGYEADQRPFKNDLICSPKEVSMSTVEELNSVTV